MNQPDQPGCQLRPTRGLLAEELDPPDLAARLLIPADAEAAGGGIEDHVAGVLEVEPGSEDGEVAVGALGEVLADDLALVAGAEGALARARQVRAEVPGALLGRHVAGVGLGGGVELGRELHRREAVLGADGVDGVEVAELDRVPVGLGEAQAAATAALAGREREEGDEGGQERAEHRRIQLGRFGFRGVYRLSGGRSNAIQTGAPHPRRSVAAMPGRCYHRRHGPRGSVEDLPGEARLRAHGRARGRRPRGRAATASSSTSTTPPPTTTTCGCRSATC